MTYYDPADVMRNKQLRPLSDETLAEIEAIKVQSQRLLDAFNAAAPSREMSLAKTKLEEAVMWAVKGLTA